MRAGLTFTASILTALAAADPQSANALGTKTSPAAFDASPVGAGPIVQMLIALALVGMGVKFALPWIVQRLGGRLSTPLNGTIKIEESANFPGGKLYVVEARGRTLLLGTTAQSINCLADLTVNDFATALADAERPSGEWRVESGETGSPTLHNSPSTLHSQLSRLERLAR